MRLNSNELSNAVRLALAFGVVSTAGAVATTAYAQDAKTGDKAESLETITVVGSRIKRTDVETSQPVFVLERAELQKTGLTSVGDILQKLSTAGSSALNTVFNNGGNGKTQIDLRNLGTQRVLVLVNGRRWTADSFGSTDLNTLPVSIIERVEVLKDGASAVYGSDAIAGVINITTRDKYNGAEASAYWGQNQHGDGEQQLYDFTIGSSSEKASVVMNVSYAQQDPIFAGDRSISRCPVVNLGCNDVNAGASSTTPYGRFREPGVAGTVTLIPGRPGTSASDFRPFDLSTDGYNFAPVNYLQTPQQRTGLYVQGRYNITDNISFKSEALFNRRESNQQLAPVPLTLGTTTIFGGPFTQVNISGSNIYNPFHTDVTRAQRRMLETGPRVFSESVDTYHFGGGFEGSFDVWGHNWTWDTNYTFNKNFETDTNTNLINLAAVANAVGPSFRDAAGNAHCGTVGHVIAGCVPLNLFGGPGSITPDMVDYIAYSGVGKIVDKRYNYSANLTGDLFELPAGPLGFAAGYEYRRDFVDQLPDPFVTAGISSTNQSNPTSGGYALNEYYLEFNVPVLKDVPGAQTLEFNIAGRYSDYSNFGSTTNGKFGFRWKPMDDLLVRGNYSQGFRAPSVGELFLGTQETFLTIHDPCVGATGATAASCAAHGVPATVEQPNSQIRVLQGGNPLLDPEKATTTTLGMVYSPNYVQGLDLYLDWYDIKLRNTINLLGANFSLPQCYSHNVFCQNVFRGPDGSIDHVSQIFENQGKWKQEGFDFTVNYKLDTDFGKFNFNWDSNYVSKFTQENLSGVAADGTLQYTTTSVVGNYYGAGLAYWRWKSNLTTDWQYGDWGATLLAHYYSHVDEDCSFAAGTTLCGTPLDEVDPQFGEQHHVLASRWYFDLQGRWDTPWNSRVSVGVNNLFDKDPPVSYSVLNSPGGANSFDPYYPVPGRFYYVQYTQKF